MLQSLTIRLETEHETMKDVLLETMKRYNEACNFVAKKAFASRLRNKYELHKVVYKEIRRQFGISSRIAIRVISKVAESYKRDISIKPIFRDLGAIQYDECNSKISIDRVSIMTVDCA